ncbi:MAG: hypothetical protein JST16_03240 [Bdellovibrionales bacterium]|nr:hypothetical protein [Bdellovibrionales bacterium]
MFNWIRLDGPSHQVTEAPASCPDCGCKEFYLQADFRRSIGLAVVTIASLATFLLAGIKADWFITWSPMVLVVMIDFVFARLSPPVLSCYKCEHRYRGIAKDKLKKFSAFDLEIHDRYAYTEAQE